MADLNGELSWERREKYLTQSVSNLIPAIPDPLFLVCSPFPNANKQFHTQIGQNVSETMFSNVYLCTKDFNIEYFGGDGITKYQCSVCINLGWQTLVLHQAVN